jgi:hypothetical protein
MADAGEEVGLYSTTGMAPSANRAPAERVADDQHGGAGGERYGRVSRGPAHQVGPRPRRRRPVLHGPVILVFDYLKEALLAASSYIAR